MHQFRPAATLHTKHLDTIYRKLGVSGRVQAVSMGLDLLPGQIDPTDPAD